MVSFLNYQDIKDLCHQKPKEFKLKLAHRFNFLDNQEELIRVMTQVKELISENQYHIQIRYTS